MRANVSEAVENILTPLDVEVEYRIPRASQKKGRARGSFAPFFRVGRRVYYRRSVSWGGSPIRSRKRLITVAEHVQARKGR